jgi:hypothetical protein
MVRVEEGAYRRGDSLTPASDEGIELLVRQLAEEMREAT